MQDPLRPRLALGISSLSTRRRPPTAGRLPCLRRAQVACSVGWSAVSSELARFAATFGSGVLLQLNLAFFLPSVPLLLLQAALDQRIDARFGRLRSNFFRVTAGGCGRGGQI